MKKFCMICFIIIAVLMCSASFATNPITVKLNENYIDFTDEVGNVVEPTIINNRTMVPMRKIFEVLGCTIDWNGETRTVTAVKDDTIIVLQINNDKATLKTGDVEEVITLDSVPVILNNRTMVPVRFIAESLNKQVGWDKDSRTVIIVDLDSIYEKVKDEVPLVYELYELFEKNKNQNIYNVNIEGSLKYTDKDDKSNNQSLSIEGDIDTVKVNDLSKAEIELEFVGKGEIYDALLDSGMQEIDMEMIIDNLAGMYYSRMFVDGEYSEWIKQEYAAMDTLENVVDESNLTVNSYETAMALVEIGTKLLGEEYLNVSGSTTKTYTWKIGIDDLFELFAEMADVSEEEYQEVVDMMDINVTYKVIAKKDVITKQIVELELELNSQETNEEMFIELEFVSVGKEDNEVPEIVIPEI